MFPCTCVILEILEIQALKRLTQSKQPYLNNESQTWKHKQHFYSKHGERNSRDWLLTSTCFCMTLEKKNILSRKNVFISFWDIVVCRLYNSEHCVAEMNILVIIHYLCRFLIWFILSKDFKDTNVVTPPVRVETCEML